MKTSLGHRYYILSWFARANLFKPVTKQADLPCEKADYKAITNLCCMRERLDNALVEATLQQSFSHTLAHSGVERVGIIMLPRKSASRCTVAHDSFLGLLWTEDPLASSTTRNGAVHCARVEVSKTTKPASRLWPRRSSCICPSRP